MNKRLANQHIVDEWNKSYNTGENQIVLIIGLNMKGNFYLMADPQLSQAKTYEMLIQLAHSIKTT